MALLHVNAENFDSEVLKSPVPVLVDFYAEWCEPCKMLGPVVEEIAGEAEGFSVAKINIDEAKELATRYKIMGVPTLLVFKNGEIAKRSTGFVNKKKILEMLQ